MTKYFYRVYDLNIASDFEFPELPKAIGNNIDVVVKREKVILPENLHVPSGYFYFNKDFQYLDFTIVGKFLIKTPSEIILEPYDGINEELIRYPLFGTVLALVLQLRGALVLHASAVHIDGKSIGFMGDKMAGKSTTAGTFIVNNYPLVTDDVLAIFDFDKPKIIPGFPQMKFTEETSSVVNIEGSSVMPKIEFPGLDKRQHNVGENFLDKITDLGRVYVLERGTIEAKIVDFNVTESLQALIRFSYFHRFGKEGLNTGRGAEVFSQAAKLAQSGFVKKIIVPNDLNRIAEIIDLVKMDLRGA